ncbi:MAG: hypothetical protein F6K47_31655 [Symploca sp. SIO2E6]|nr:hypothetical protein [Symploca sp. SIO2E6]
MLFVVCCLGIGNWELGIGNWELERELERELFLKNQLGAQSFPRRALENLDLTGLSSLNCPYRWVSLPQPNLLARHS